jgi:hypothetical protein
MNNYPNIKSSEEWRQTMWGSIDPIHIDRMPNGEYRCRLMAGFGYGDNPCIAVGNAYAHWKRMTGFEVQVLLAYHLKKAREAERKASNDRAIMLGVGLGILL